jgi:prophage regulatory protein
MIGQPQAPVRLLRLPDVTRLVGLSAASVYRLISKGQFPHQVRIMERAVGWRRDEIDQWITSRPAGQSETPRPQPRRGPRLPVPAEAAAL